MREIEPQRPERVALDWVRPRGEALRSWLGDSILEVGALVRALHCMSPTQWWSFILDHPAHRHCWYNTLSKEANLSDFADFFYENQGAPAFVDLIQRTLHEQVTEEARAAVQENLEDERKPLPHKHLMMRLMEALSPHRRFTSERHHSQLQARQNVLWAGYELEPWQLVGSLFAIECMGSFRMTKMEEGLKRLGLSERDREYVRLHTTCDEHHASDWCHRVILSSLEVKPDLRARMIHGIALVLEMDRRYLCDKEKQYELTHRRKRGTRSTKSQAAVF